MRKNLKTWTHPATGVTRIYISGTTRDHNKLFIVDNDGKIQSHSVNIDGTKRTVGGNIYKKREQDINAIWEVLTAFGYGSSETSFNVIADAANGKIPLIEVIKNEE